MVSNSEKLKLISKCCFKKQTKFIRALGAASGVADDVLLEEAGQTSNSFSSLDHEIISLVVCWYVYHLDISHLNNDYTLCKILIVILILAIRK